jgi:1-acyl-sn-glycerol-3-phosphate acyltransferase
MEILKRIFGFFWALWAAFWFMVVVVIFTPVYAIILGVFGKKYSMACVWINVRYLSPFLLAISLIRLKVFGKENIDLRKTYVFVANHLAQVDIIATASAMPQPIRFLAKAEIKYIPFFGYMTRMLAIMVDRQNKASRDKSVLYMVEELKRGNSIFLYPEGTRNRTPQSLKEFKDGAFRVAILAQVQLVVQTLVGTKEVNNPKGIQLYPGKIEAHFSAPIETKGMTLDDLELLKERVRVEMMSHLNKTGA